MRPGSRIAVLALAILSACGREEPDPPKPPPPPPVPDLPDLGTVELWEWNEIDTDTALKIEGEVPETLLWDFSEGKQYSYDMTQTLHQIRTQTAGEEKITQKSADRNRGKFVFSGGSGNRGKVMIAIKTVESSINDVPLPDEVIGKKKPTQFECRLGEDGTAEVTNRTGQGDPRFLFDALLALKPGTREVNDGTTTTRRAGRWKVGPHECVRLETEFRYAPESTEGRSLIEGRTVAYFSLEKRRFVRSTTAMSARLATRTLGEDGMWRISVIRTETVQKLKLREAR